LHIDELLTELVSREGSDLHMRVGEPPVFRIHGKLTRTDLPVITAVEDYLFPILNDERKQRFADNMELDLSYEIEGLSRFRVNSGSAGTWGQCSGPYLSRSRLSTSLCCLW
jgi:twitching motility protein PilT